MIQPHFSRCGASIWGVFVLACLSVLTPSHAETPPRHCATTLTHQWRNAALGHGPDAAYARQQLTLSARVSRPMAERPAARTLTTPHFVLHYALWGIHQIKTVAQDDSLMKLADSLRSKLSALGDAARDSAVYAGLDASQAPHPDFAVRAGRIFEQAYAYYVDTLGMVKPQGTANSQVFKTSPAAGGHFVIDIADIGNFARRYANGEYYGLTLEPPNLIVLLENDFLFRTQLGPTGEVSGDSVSSRLNGRVIHNYAREYDLGLRLTIYHEFFHVMQYNYVPEHPFGYHAWYELSAVGMEERKVPEGNDYLQYLPCIFRSPEAVGLLATGDAVCNPEAAYSNGIFHMYLTRRIGDRFDAPLWQTLAANGDDLTKALPEVLQSLGLPLQQALPDFAARLLLAGRPARPEHFVSDMPEWPPMFADSVHPDELQIFQARSLEPYAFLPLRLASTFKDDRITAGFPGDSTGYRIRITDDTLETEAYAEPSVVLGPQAGEGEHWLLVCNLRANAVGTFQMNTGDLPFRFYPNPLPLGTTDALYFTRTRQITYPAHIEIFNEAGKKVYDQQAEKMSALVDWNLRDAKNRRIGSGIYYLKLNGGRWQPWVVLP